MTMFKDKDDFYKNFIIPLINKCLKHIKNNGWVCFNISPKMYKDLTEKYNYQKCSYELDLKQQMGGKTDGKNQYSFTEIGKKKKAQDKIYCWRNTNEENTGDILEIADELSEEEQTVEEDLIKDYNKMKVSQLKKECRVKGIRKYSKLKKEELIEKLKKH